MYKLIFMDFSMPGLNGPETSKAIIEEIKQFKKNSNSLLNLNSEEIYP